MVPVLVPCVESDQNLNKVPPSAVVVVVVMVAAALAVVVRVAEMVGE